MNGGARVAASFDECVDGAQAIVLTTPWPEFLGAARRLEALAARPRIVVDCWRNAQVVGVPPTRSTCRSAAQCERDDVERRQVAALCGRQLGLRCDALACRRARHPFRDSLLPRAERHHSPAAELTARLWLPLEQYERTKACTVKINVLLLSVRSSTEFPLHRFTFHLRAHTLKHMGASVCSECDRLWKEYGDVIFAQINSGINTQLPGLATNRPGTARSPPK